VEAGRLRIGIARVGAEVLAQTCLAYSPRGLAAGPAVLVRCAREAVPHMMLLNKDFGRQLAEVCVTGLDATLSRWAVGRCYAGDVHLPTYTLSSQCSHC